MAVYPQVVTSLQQMLSAVGEGIASIIGGALADKPS